MIALMLSCQNKIMSTPAQISYATNISTIDLHHAIASLQRANLCRYDKGVVVLLPLPDTLGCFLNEYYE